MFENYALFSTFIRHRLTVDEPGDLLSITPQTSTEQEQVVA
jgi:hypothetical protein